MATHLRYTKAMSTKTTLLALMYGQRITYDQSRPYFDDLLDGVSLDETLERHGTLNIPLRQAIVELDKRDTLPQVVVKTVIVDASDLRDYLESALALSYGSVSRLGRGVYPIIESEMGIEELLSAEIAGSGAVFKIEHPEWLMGYLRDVGVIHFDATHVIIQ